jgi:Ca2+-binding EF-hand superfamily protein
MTKYIIGLLFIMVTALSCSSTKEPTSKHVNTESRTLERNQMQGKPEAEKLIRYLDKDNDGKISMSEAKNAKNGKLFERFTRIDTNNDSYLTKEELEKSFKNRPKK